MEVRSYNRELVYANMLFKRPFSNIEIQTNGQTKKAQCVFGNRSRIIKALENPERKAMYSLPLIIIQRTGIEKDDERLANVWNEVKYRTTSKRMNYNLFTPVPITISYTVTFMSKYQSDIDIMLSNFMPFFNKDLFFTAQHPKFSDIQWKNQVIMDNSIQEDIHDEIDSGTDDIITATCTFSYKTYLFCGEMKSRTVIKEQISSVLSIYPFGYLSSYVYKLTDDEKDHIDDFLSAHPSCDLSTTLQTALSGEQSSYVSCIVSAEEEVYDGLIPEINNIGIGWYDTPTISDHVEFMDFVDQLCATGYDDKPGVDRFILKIDSNGDLGYNSPYPSENWDWEGYRNISSN